MTQRNDLVDPPRRQFEFMNSQITELEQQIAALVEALDAVEFVSITDQERCPWCGGIRPDYPAKKLVESVGFIVGHTKDCKRQQALALVEGDE